MHFNASWLKGKHLLALWLDHLALCASEQYETGDSNLLITRDSTLGFATLDTEKAVDQLRTYCELYIQGQAYPLPIFPLTSYAWACQSDSQRALKAAHKAWFGNEFRSIPGDRDNAYVRLALRGSVQEPFNSVEFTSLAKKLYAGAFEAVVES
jgi:exodeoxyribonuclease V gamma subunit